MSSELFTRTSIDACKKPWIVQGGGAGRAEY